MYSHQCIHLYGRLPHSQNVILNKVYGNNVHISSFICLIIKNRLYAMRCMKQMPNWAEIQMHMQKIRTFQKYKAKTEGKMYKFLDKWNELQTNNEVETNN